MPFSRAVLAALLTNASGQQFVAFLADPKKSGFINGSALQIDGGIGGRLYDPE